MKGHIILTIVLAILILVTFTVHSELYIIPEMVTSTGFNIQENVDKVNNTTDYTVSCANVNNNTPSPNFSFKYGVTDISCGDFRFMCPASDRHNRVSVISPNNRGQLFCVYTPK